MEYGSLQQDELVIDFDDNLDIVDYPKDTESGTETDTSGEGDIENQIKNTELPLVATNNEIIHHSTAIHNANVRDTKARDINAHIIARSTHRSYKPLVMTICSNIELTVPQMIILFVATIFLEYFILLIIIR